MRTDGQTDMRKLTVAFRNFAKAPKNAGSFRLPAERRGIGSDDQRVEEYRSVTNPVDCCTGGLKAFTLPADC